MGILAFFAGPIGRWVIVGALIVSSYLAGNLKGHNAGYKEGIDVGAQHEIAQAKENAKAVIALDAKNRKLEQDHAMELAKLGAQYAQNLKTAKARHDADVAAARAGAIRLSIPSGCADANGGAAGAAAGPAPGGDGQARTDLPGEITADLLTLANDADEVVGQLSACQGVIQSYLSLNAKGPP